LYIKNLIFILAIINRSGHDCPYSLQLIVCLLLYEITAFLRETYETLPKFTSLSTAGVHSRQQQRTNQSQTVIDTSSATTDKRFSDRLRMDSVVSQASNRSTISLSNEQLLGMNFDKYFSSFVLIVLVSPQMLSATVINMNPSANERHISFAVKKENDSNDSNHTAIVMNDNESTIDGSLMPGIYRR
jgi:heme-binding NEAT domain protein